MLARIILLLCLSVATSALPQSGRSTELKLDGEPRRLAMYDGGGKSFNLADFHGKPILLSFFFTNCPTACPVQTSKLAAVHKTLSDDLRQQTTFLSISIDPEMDAPERVRQFTDGFKIDVNSWIFGVPQSKTELAPLLAELNIAISKDPASKVLDHQMTVLLLNSKGKIMQRYLGTRFNGAQLQRDMAAVLRLDRKK